MRKYDKKYNIIISDKTKRRFEMKVKECFSIVVKEHLENKSQIIDMA